MRESWTDARMDDLNLKVDELGRRVENGFDRVDADLRELRQETSGEFVSIREQMDRRFDHVDRRFDHVDRRFEQIDGRFEQIDGRFEQIDGRFEALEDRLVAMHRLMLQFSGLVIAALIGLIATQL